VERRLRLPAVGLNVVGIVVGSEQILGLVIPHVRMASMSFDVFVLLLVLLEALVGHELLLLEGTRQKAGFQVLDG
jgi:hypothetical protein